MDDRFEPNQRLGIGEDNARQPGAIYLSIGSKHPCPEGVNHGFIARGILRDGAMTKGVGINAIRAEMLQHLAHHALTRGYISS
jgi:hypothetical protein